MHPRKARNRRWDPQKVGYFLFLKVVVVVVVVGSGFLGKLKAVGPGLELGLGSGDFGIFEALFPRLELGLELGGTGILEPLETRLLLALVGVGVFFWHAESLGALSLLLLLVFGQAEAPRALGLLVFDTLGLLFDLGCCGGFFGRRLFGRGLVGRRLVGGGLVARGLVSRGLFGWRVFLGGGLTTLNVAHSDAYLSKSELFLVERQLQAVDELGLEAVRRLPAPLELGAQVGYLHGLGRERRRHGAEVRVSTSVNSNGFAEQNKMQRLALRLVPARRALADYVMKVPAMGDSITEGTIASWEKAVGDAVAADDVVATIETDKVAVEVRAEVGGSIVHMFAQVNDTVEVGKPLLKLDTDAAVPAAAPAAAPAAQPEVVAAAPPKRAHVPLIKFLGKRSLVKRPDPPAPVVPPPRVPASSPDAKDVLAVGAFFGRPLLTEAEIDAVQSGGATLLG